MIQTNRIEIALNKSRIFATLIGAFSFVAVGFVMIFFAAYSERMHPIEKVLLVVVGLISILFFGFAGISISRKFTDPSPGLIIDEYGVTDNSSGLSSGFIHWENIAQVNSINMVNQQFVVIILYDPEEIIDHYTKTLSKMAARKNLQLSGSPVNISANSLKCSHDELLFLLQQHLTEFRKNQLAESK